MAETNFSKGIGHRLSTAAAANEQYKIKHAPRAQKASRKQFENMWTPAPKRCNVRVKPHHMHTLITHQPRRYSKKTRRIRPWGAAPCSNPMSFFEVPPWLTRYL